MPLPAIQVINIVPELLQDSQNRGRIISLRKSKGSDLVTQRMAIPYQVSLRSCCVTSRQGRSPDLGYVDFRMTKH
jgi:hypothetical protein